MKPEKFSALLESLREIAEKATKETKETQVDMDLLRSEIEIAIHWYTEVDWGADRANQRHNNS